MGLTKVDKLMIMISNEKAEALSKKRKAKIKKRNKDYEFYNGMSAAFSLCMDIIEEWRASD